LKISDLKEWFHLRDALHSLQDGKVLKTCAVMSLMVAVEGKIRNERVLAEARDYDAPRKSGATSVGDAVESLRKLSNTIDQFDSRRPDFPILKNVTVYKQALCDLALAALEGLEQIYRLEKGVASPEVLKVIQKASLRQIKADMPHISSRTAGEQHWEAMLDLLDALEEIRRRPDPSQWAQHPPPRDSKEGGNSLRKDVEKLSKGDVESLARWFDLMAPGLYERFESDPNQLAILGDYSKAEPRFSPLASYVIPLALLHQDDLASIRAPKE